MPAPLYGADDARRCSGNSVSEVLDKFRKNYDRIMSLPQETKEEKEFRHCIWLAEKEERERIYQTSIRPFRKATYTHFPEYIDPRLRNYRSRYLPICRIEGAHPESGFDEDFQMEQQANAEFIAAASPATVLALLDERERNQQYIKLRDQENEEIALTVGKLRVELEAAEKRIAELQLREVVLPQCYSMLHRVDFDEPYHTEMVYRQHQVLEALHNAGINVTEAGKGEAS